MQTDYQTESLMLHFVTTDDLPEVMRTWPSDHRPVSGAEAREAIASMRGNYERNTEGRICHLCLAVCGKEHPGTIMGWCGLDGTRNHSEPEIFILLDEAYRNKIYAWHLQWTILTKRMRNCPWVQESSNRLQKGHGV